MPCGRCFCCRLDERLLDGGGTIVSDGRARRKIMILVHGEDGVRRLCYDRKRVENRNRTLNLILIVRLGHTLSFLSLIPTYWI